MRYFCILALLASLQVPATGATIINTQGTRDFVDGAQLDDIVYYTGNTDLITPFDNAESGFDGDGSDGVYSFDVTWTHDHGILNTIFSAVLRIGLWEHESDEAGNQVSSLTLNTLFGASLTALLDAQLEGKGGTTVYETVDDFTYPVSTEYNIYSISLPAAVFSELAGGSAQFRLQLQGPGVNILGPSQYNGAFIDFAELEITEVPEASTLLLIGAFLPALMLLRRR